MLFLTSNSNVPETVGWAKQFYKAEDKVYPQKIVLDYWCLDMLVYHVCLMRAIWVKVNARLLVLSPDLFLPSKSHKYTTTVATHYVPQSIGHQVFCVVYWQQQKIDILSSKFFLPQVFFPVKKLGPHFLYRSHRLRIASNSITIILCSQEQA